MFATLLETGRVNILLSRERPLLEPGSAFVIARLLLKFKAELNWLGEAHIGTRAQRVGRSSVTLEQTIVRNGAYAATAETVIVMMDEAARKPRLLPASAIAGLEEVQVASSR